MGDYKDKKAKGLISFPKITITEIKTNLKKMKPNSAHGFDGIHNCFLKNMPQSLAESIVLLFNKFQEADNMPSAWKQAKITMIPKKDQPKSNPSGCLQLVVSANFTKELSVQDFTPS